MSKFKLPLMSNRNADLELPPLLDLFAILLLFLLAGFQQADEDFVLKSGLHLPKSTAKSTFKSGINLAITKNAIFVEGKKVYALRHGRLPAQKDMDSGKINRVVSAVRLAAVRAKNTAKKRTVLIQASKKTPYRTLHLVMRSAFDAGAGQFRLAVARE